MRIICLGAGAIGGYFGGRLIEGGQPVTFLVRERRKRQLLSDGLRIKSQYGDFSSPVEAIMPDEIDGPADIVFLTCKAYDLEPAMEITGPAIGPDTAILPLLNGIAHMEILNERFGKDRVLGGLAKIAATMDSLGQIVHLNDWRFIKFGEQDGSDTERVRALKAVFDRTSVIATATPDILHEMWSKVVHLSTVAGMTTLMRASVGEIASTPDGTALFLDLLEKNAEIARREGFAPTEEFLSEYRDLFHDTTSTYTASMLRDIERHGPTEADHIIGFMCRKAREHGLDDRFHRIIYTHLKAYEERRRAERF